MIKENKKVINAWCMYDWANSVYSLEITSAIFPAYYKAVTTNKGIDSVRYSRLQWEKETLFEDIHVFWSNSMYRFILV